MSMSLCLCCVSDVGIRSRLCARFFFFFNDTATTEIYTLSLHDALPISEVAHVDVEEIVEHLRCVVPDALGETGTRSEEHTSELQSPCNLVCRLLLEKKKNPNVGPVPRWQK